MPNSLLFVLIVILSSFHVCTSKKDKGTREKSNDASEKWKQKDVRDYNDADLERLLDQWEESDEDTLEEDELPEWKRQPPKIDLSQIDPSDPEGFLKMSKKGRTLMMFVTVSGNPTEEETEKISTLWHSSLFNAHFETQRQGCQPYAKTPNLEDQGVCFRLTPARANLSSLVEPSRSKTPTGIALGVIRVRKPPYFDKVLTPVMAAVGDNRVLFMLKDGSKAWEIRDFLVKQERCEEVSIEGQSYPGAGADKSKVKNDKRSPRKVKNKKVEL